MPLSMTGLVGAARRPDDTESPIRLGSQGEVIVSDMNGFWYEQVMRGNGYVFSTALAGNALVAATTTNAPALWNPPNSGLILVIQKISYNRTAIGTPLEGGIVYLKMRASGLGTGADIISATIVAGINLRYDLGDQSGMLFAPTTISTTLTPTFLCNAGISQAASTGTTTGTASLNMIDYVNGIIQVPPGWMFSIGAQVSLSTTYSISIQAFSLPLPLVA